MRATIKVDALEVDKLLYDFVSREALPGTGIDETAFWRGFSSLLRRLSPRNAELLAKRDALQARIDTWHVEHPGPGFDPVSYKAFLTDIGYLTSAPSAFSVTTKNVDDEIARVAGPQLVVPVSNARYALNAANARWGSLYDALYGTDAIPYDTAAPQTKGYDPARGAKVIAFARSFLDDTFPLIEGSHRDAVGYRVTMRGLEVRFADGTSTTTRKPALAGFQGDSESPTVMLFEHHGLHVEIHIDRQHFIGRDDAAGVSDIVLEAALTTIQDCEDSVAAVSTEDKIGVYRNWLGLMQGTLQAELDKGSKRIVRRLNPDRTYKTLGGGDKHLPGRSLMLVRNVGHHMMSDSITLDGKPIPETLMDAVITALAALHDLQQKEHAEKFTQRIGVHRQTQNARARRSCIRE